MEIQPTHVSKLHSSDNKVSRLGKGIACAGLHMFSLPEPPRETKPSLVGAD